MIVVKLGARSHRTGKVFHVGHKTRTVSDGNDGRAKGWESTSTERAAC